MSCANSSSIQPAPYMTITSIAKDISVTSSVVVNSGLHNYYYSHYNRNPSSTIMQHNPNNLNMSNGIFTNGNNNNCNIQNSVDISYLPFLNPSCSNTQYDIESSSLHPWATTAAAAIAAAAAYMPQQNSFSEGILAPSSLLINSPHTQTQQQLYYSNLASDNLSPNNISHNITNGCGMIIPEENTDELLNSYAALQSQRLLINEHNHPITINNSNVTTICTPSTTGIESWNNISRTSPSFLYQNITNDSLCSSSSSTSSSVASTSQQDDYTNMLINGNNNFNRQQQQYKWMQVKRPISKFSGL